MRVGLCCTALLLALLPRVLSAQPEAAPLQITAQEAVLPNGLKILVVEDHTTPVISVQLWVHTGSKNERPGITGISHLFEHMMFMGSRKYGAEEHSRIIQANGGVVNAYTNTDVTVFYEDLPSDKLDLALQLEAERFMNLAITDANLKTEREVVKEERRLRTDNRPTGRAFEELLAAAFKAHPYQWPTVGWMTDLDAITLDDCKGYFRSHYVPNGTVLVVAGDVTVEAVVKSARKTLGKWKRLPPAPPVVSMEAEQKGERRVILKAPVQNPTLMGGFHTPGWAHPDHAALEVLSRVLSSGRSSRLYQKLVYEEQTALYAEGGVMRTEHPGLFYIVASVKPAEDPRKVEDSFWRELDRFKTEPVTDRELQKAKNQLESELVFSLKRVSNLAGSVGRAEVLGGSWKLVNEQLPARRAVTKEDLMRVARTYLHADNRTLVTLIPETPAPKPENGRRTP